MSFKRSPVAMLIGIILIAAGIALHTLKRPLFIIDWIHSKMPPNSAAGPVILEIRAGELFIHDPAKPISGPKVRDYVLAEFSDITIVQKPVPFRKATRGALRLTGRPLSCPQSGLVIDNCDISILNSVAQLLRPWIKQARSASSTLTTSNKS
jgi:hypothetical protein